MSKNIFMCISYVPSYVSPMCQASARQERKTTSVLWSLFPGGKNKQKTGNPTVVWGTESPIAETGLKLAL